MKPENKRMQEFLKLNGINAIPKYIETGSLKQCWRLYGKVRIGKSFSCYQKWTPVLISKLTDLGFRDYDNDCLDQYSGNGGVFSVFVRGHNELLGGCRK